MNIDTLINTIDIYTANNTAIAFSGGVDSSLLLKLTLESARRNKTNVYAITVKTPFTTQEDIDTACRAAEEMKAEHIIIHISSFNELGISHNPPDRCYICKKNIFTQIIEMAKELGVTTILEGTNYDDMNMYRPGIKAIRELNIISPLAQCRITKNDIRRLAEHFGISTAKRPSTPCFATRFPYNTYISYEDIINAEKGENYIKSLGFHNVRLRVHGNIARIEVDEEYYAKAISLRYEIIDKLKSLGYDYVVLDMEGFRSGSMDITLNS